MHKCSLNVVKMVLGCCLPFCSLPSIHLIQTHLPTLNLLLCSTLLQDDTFFENVSDNFHSKVKTNVKIATRELTLQSPQLSTATPVNIMISLHLSLHCCHWNQKIYKSQSWSWLVCVELIEPISEQIDRVRRSALASDDGFFSYMCIPALVCHLFFLYFTYSKWNFIVSFFWKLTFFHLIHPHLSVLL